MQKTMLKIEVNEIGDGNYETVLYIAGLLPTFSNALVKQCISLMSRLTDASLMICRRTSSGIPLLHALVKEC